MWMETAIVGRFQRN